MRAYTTNDQDDIQMPSTMITSTQGANISPLATSITDERESEDEDDYVREMVHRPSEVMVVDFNKSTKELKRAMKEFRDDLENKDSM